MSWRDIFMNEQGFTFVELILTVSFLMIMAGIAGSQYSFYKKQGFNAAASTDMRNAMTALEVYSQDNDEYPTCNSTNCKDILPGFESTVGVQITFIGDAELSVTGVACHTKGDIRYIFTGIPGLIVGLRTGACGI